MGILDVPGASAASLSNSFTPKWKTATAYTAGQQVVSPNGDIVSAIANHTSGASFTPANWNLSPTFAQPSALLTNQVLALGTSIAFGTGASSTATAYPARTQARLQTVLGATYNVVAGGVSGDTTTQMLSRLPALLSTNKPAFVTIEASVNDSRVDLTVSQATTIDNLRNIIALCKLARAVPVLITSTWFNPTTFGSASYNSTSVIKAAGTNMMVRALAKDLNVPLVDMYSIFPKDGTLLADGLHPNDAGHDLWGVNIGSIIAHQAGPAAQHTIVYDDFKRADSAATLGSALTGQAWTASKGTWGISSNAAYSATAIDDDIALIETGNTDMAVEAVGTRVPSGATWAISIIARATDASNLYLADAGLSGGVTTAHIYKRVANTYTVIASATVTNIQAGDRLRFSAIGSSLVLSQNGRYILGIEDSTIKTGTKAGLRQALADPNRTTSFTVSAV